MQVIENYITKDYGSADTDATFMLRQLMLSWLQQLNVVKSFAVYIANKMARLFSLVFVVDFPIRWSTFFKDLFFDNLQQTQFKIVPLVDFYLRTLIAIDSEVADKEIQRSKEVCINFD